MAQSQQVPVSEKRREIVFITGQRLNLTNVVSYDHSGTWLRIWSDEGLTILNPDKILYHTVKSEQKKDQQV